VTGAAGLALLSIGTVGMKGCVGWAKAVRFYGWLATGPATALRRSKYMDLGSFFHLLLGNASTLAEVLAVVGALAGLGILAAAWWESSDWSAERRDLLWAATLAGALVCNVYTPIYDTILVGPAVALAAGVMLSRGGQEREAFAGWLVLLYIVPWMTQSFAEFLRFQPFTVILAGFAWWALGRARGMRADQTGGEPAHSQDFAEGVAESVAEGATYHGSLGVTSYAVCCRTGNSDRRLSVFLRSYSPAWAILWERDR